MTAAQTLRLSGVTMTEAVEGLRQHGVFVQLERERLEPGDVDRGRPIADSRRRFEVELDLSLPAGRVLSRLTAADGRYDWLQLTDDPASYFVWPRSDGDRFAGSLLAYAPGEVPTAGRPLAESVADVLARSPHEIAVFDRPGLLERATGPAVETAGRRAFEVLGDLCAHSGARIVWTLAGLGDGRVLTIGALP